MFPQESEKLKGLLERIEESDQLRTHFAANMAENINNVKTFVVKSEYALMLKDMASLKRYYATVQQENSSLIGEYLKRHNNHQELLNALKELNQIFKMASNLRGKLSKI